MCKDEMITHQLFSKNSLYFQMLRHVNRPSLAMRDPEKNRPFDPRIPPIRAPLDLIWIFCLHGPRVALDLIWIPSAHGLRVPLDPDFDLLRARSSDAAIPRLVDRRARTPAKVWAPRSVRSGRPSSSFYLNGLRRISDSRWGRGPHWARWAAPP